MFSALEREMWLKEREKVYQIWEKIKLDKKRKGCSQHVFYQAPFGIWLCLENNISDKLISRLKLKKMPLHLLSNYFQSIYVLKLAGDMNMRQINLLEECLLTDLPIEAWEKLNYDEQKQELSSSEKETINTIKSIIKKNQKITIVEEKNFWKAFFPKPLSNLEEKKYYTQLQKELENIKFQQNIKFYTNIEEWTTPA